MYHFDTEIALQIVAKVVGTSAEHIRSRSRFREAANGRQLMMSMMVRTGDTHASVSRFFNRDPSTVWYSIHAVEEVRQLSDMLTRCETEYAAQIEANKNQVVVKPCPHCGKLPG